MALYIHTAQSKVAELAADPQLRDVSWHKQLTVLQLKLSQLEQAMQYLLTQYQQPGWLYPAIPLIAGTMFEANVAIDTGLLTAINETRSQLDQPGQIGLYTRLVDLRDQWRRMILDFRSSMIQFAGLPSAPIPDDSTMAQLLVALEKGTYDVHTNFKYTFQDKNYKNKLRDEAFLKEVKKKPQLLKCVINPPKK